MQSIICSIALSIRNTLGISNTTNCYRYIGVRFSVQFNLLLKSKKLRHSEYNVIKEILPVWEGIS